MMMAAKLGFTDRTVRKAIPQLISAGLLIDHNRRLRNVPHRYEVTIDWSFSYRLRNRVPAAEREPEVVSTAPAPAPEYQHRALNQGKCFKAKR
jgi:DNA-binding GntR family transcriptional regulator